MRRRWLVPPAAVLVVAAACSSTSDVALVQSDEINGTTTTAPSTTAPSGETSEPPPSVPTPETPPTSSPVPPESTPTTVPDLPTPDDCVPLPDDAPPLLITTDEGVVYQVGPGGTQMVADSEDLPAPITTAWRATGGTLWVGLGPNLSVGRLDGGEYEESASGNVSLQHVGEMNGDPVALWFDFGGISPDATEGGRIVLEHADGTQDDLGPASSATDSVTVGNIGANTVLLTRNVRGESVFRYVDASGRPAHDDWYNPTDRPSEDGAIRSSAAVSDDGRTLIWTEQVRTLAGAQEPAELVIGRTSGPEIQKRVTLGSVDEGQTTGDFDGRWAVASFSDGFQSTRTLLIDTEASAPETIVPCVPIGSATIDRAGGGESPPPTTPPTTEPATTEAPTTTQGPAPPGSAPSTQVGGPVDP